MKIKKLFSLPLACMMCTSFFVSAAAEIDADDTFYSSFLNNMQPYYDYTETIKDINELESGHIFDSFTWYLGGLAITCDDIAQLQSNGIGEYTVEWSDGDCGLGINTSWLPDDTCRLQPVKGYAESFGQIPNYGMSGTQDAVCTISSDFSEAGAPVYVVTIENELAYGQIMEALLKDSNVTLLGSVYGILAREIYWNRASDYYTGIFMTCAPDFDVQQLQEEYDIRAIGDNKWRISVPEDMTAVEAVELCTQLTQRAGILDASPTVAVPDSTDSVSGCSIALESFYTDLPGDLNADCVADISDAVLLARVVTEDDAVPVYGKSLNNADVDGDGLLTIMDVTALLDHIANIPAES